MRARPIVQTLRSAALFGNSWLIRCASSYSAVAASRRRAIIVVPAWFCWPREDEAHAAQPDDRVDDADALVRVLERRALLDMRFEKPGVACRVELHARYRGKPRLANRGFERHAVAIDCVALDVGR
jgi:hypothetical protein